jgi:hypothetical protein
VSEFFSNVPEIIRAASKDSFSLIALVVLVVGFMTYQLFIAKSSSELTRVFVFLCVGVGGVFFVVVMLGVYLYKQELSSDAPPTPGRTAADSVQPNLQGLVDPSRVTPSIPTPITQTTPAPLLAAQRPAVRLGSAAPRHNVPVLTAMFGTVPGLQLLVGGDVVNGVNLSVQTAVRFGNVGGDMFFANLMEPVYRDQQGLLSTYTPVRTIRSNPENILQTVDVLAVPYYALENSFSLGSTTFTPVFTVFVYLNNQLAAQSTPIQY